MEYNFKKIEEKWQEIWKKNGYNNKENGEKKYIVPMFPYPSGNIHMGHIRNYTISDVIARYYRKNGYNVCHPIGWDSFGMPAETAAIKNNIHPKEWTDRNIQNMKSEMIKTGISFDWDKEISTCDVDYWKYEQKFFIDMWKAGYIERKKGIVNWDPIDESVIANEQVINGRGWRSGAIIERREMTQYYFKTTMFAEEMYDSIKDVEDFWPKIITTQQKNFIKNGTKKDGISIPFSDWCVSRQRYWGTPIPMIHCNKCGTIPNEDIPVKPPFEVEFNGKGNPIYNHPSWKNCKCPICNSDAHRETDTMDTFVQSSWYFIKYISEISENKFDEYAIKKWFPIDYYIGGPEHATSHMIYSRFFWRIFKKIGYINDESPKDPFKKVISQGIVKKDGRKMSKSQGNGVSPTEIIEKFGADTCRMYIMFAGPVDQDIDWCDSNIIGIYRFINRFWNGQFKVNNNIPNKIGEEIAIEKINKIIKKIPIVYEETYKFNTIIASAMEVYNAINKQNNEEIYKSGYKAIIEAIFPIIPHICSEMKENFI